MTALPKGEPRVCAPLYRRIPRRREAVRPYNRLPYLRLILALSFRASDRRHWRGNPSPLLRLRRPKAATYPCRSAAKARFDNRHPPKGVSKEGGPQPSLFGRSRMRDFQGGRKIETSFPLEWRSLDTFFRQGKKVSRRRHPAPGRGTPLASLCEGSQAVEKARHCEPVRRLAWQSVLKTHGFCALA